MNLVVDVGNTRVKLAVFQSNKLKLKKEFVIDDFNKEITNLFQENSQIKKAILSSVGLLKKNNIKLLSKYTSVLVLNNKTNIPFDNKYKTPETLGVDRIALTCAAVTKFPKNNVLVIDAGTCITYDFVTKDKKYLGGAISPGISVRYKSLNNLTANLPLLQCKKPIGITGESSEESIHSGVINGVLFEIEGVVMEYEKKYEHLTVILTGGDGEFLSKQLKSSIFANSNFLLEGLNYILEFNSNE